MSSPRSGTTVGTLPIAVMVLLVVGAVVAPFGAATASALIDHGRNSAAGLPSSISHPSSGGPVVNLCDIPCGSQGSSYLVNITFKVSGVPATVDGYPVYVAINMAMEDSSTCYGPPYRADTNFEEVPVAGGLNVIEGVCGSGGTFTGTYNTAECDVLNPNEGCYSDANYIEYNDLSNFFNFPGDKPGYSDTPFYSPGVPDVWKWAPGCDGGPYGTMYLNGGQSTTITLQYEDCIGYTGGSGDGDSNFTDQNTTTGPWNFTEANGTEIGDLNLTDNDAGIISGGGTGCALCVIDENDAFEVSLNDTFAPLGGGTGLGIPLSLVPGTYGWQLSLSGFTTNPSRGSFAATPGGNVDLSGTIERTYRVSVTETGLPTASDWSVALSNGGHTGPTDLGSGSSLNFALPNGTYGFVASSNNYTESSTVSSFSVDGGMASLSIAFLGAPTYRVAVNETGLPAGTPWQLGWANVTGPTSTLSGIQGTSGTLTTLWLRNGSYTIVASAGTWFSAAPTSTGFAVAGAGGGVLFAFTGVPTVVLKFEEKGLPKGSDWGLSIGVPAHSASSSSASIPLAVTISEISSTVCTGNLTTTLPLGYAFDKVAGKCGPLSKTVVLSFSHVAELTFRELNLPEGTVWTLAVSASNGGRSVLTSQDTAASSITLYLPAGKYSWAVSTWSTFSKSPRQGTLTLPAAGLTKTIKFKLITAKYTFLEMGLPHGETWWISVVGPVSEMVTSSGGSGVFHLENGTYNFTVWADGGYTPAPAAGTFTVATANGAKVIDIAFAA
ncbi:MAG: hypothetical protein WAK40_04850 [Thermoplasmata archaeon]